MAGFLKTRGRPSFTLHALLPTLVIFFPLFLLLHNLVLVQVRMPANQFGQTILTEHLTIVVFGFADAIGEDYQAVAGSERELCLLVRAIRN